MHSYYRWLILEMYKLIYTSRILVFLLLIVVTNVYSQTIVGDTVRGVWSKNGSPFIIKHDVYVDGILNIEPGVVVLFEGFYKLFSRDGSIIAKGTPQDSIYFTSTRKERSSWWGIYATHINKTVATPSTYEYCVIEYSDRGIAISMTVSKGVVSGDTIRNCVFRDNRIGTRTLWDYGSRGYILSSEYYRNDIGIWTDRYYHPFLVESCYIHHNNFGINLEGEGGTYYRNVITDNDSMGIRIEHYIGGGFVFGGIDKCNKIYNNPINIMFGDGLSGDGKPDLIDATNNYWGSTEKLKIRPTIKGRISYIPFTDENCNTVTTSIRESNVQNILSAEVYPNPLMNNEVGNQTLTYKVDAPTELIIDVRDLLGRLILERNLDAVQAGEHRLTLPQLTPGMFFIKLYNKKSMIVKKFIVMR